MQRCSGYGSNRKRENRAPRPRSVFLHGTNAGSVRPPTRGAARAMVARHRIMCGILPLSLISMLGCGELLGPLAASLGGSVPGDRGTVRVLFINNTAHRAAFTFGSYDPLDTSAPPDFGQFVIDGAGSVLDGQTSSVIITGACARVFSVGSPGLLDRVLHTQSDVTIAGAAAETGVRFVDVGDENVLTDVGTAPPFEARLGFDFSCEALLIIRFEVEDSGEDPFRLDFELIPSASTR